MKKELLQMAEKYGFENIINKINSIEENQTIFIGFLGEFSSGKSTLINALLGEKILPSMAQPTSKSIVEIIPTSSVEHTEFFEKKENNVLFPIDAVDFSAIALGDKEGTVVIKTKSNEFLKDNIVIIDTPGLVSLDKLDTDITFGYLPFLDGAFICQDINQGGFTKSILKFLEKKEISPIINNFIFLLTKGDVKPPSSLNEIKEKAIVDLKNSFPASLTNVNSKVIITFALKALEENNFNLLNDLKDAIQNHIINKKIKILKEKQTKELKSLANEIIEMLKFKKENMTLNDDELEKQQQDLKTDIEKSQKNKEKIEADLNELTKAIKNDVFNITQGFFNLFKSAEKDEIDNITSDMSSEILASISTKIRNYFDAMEMPRFSTDCMNQITQHIKKVIKIGQLTKVIATAAITSVVAPGTSLASNAAEATIGGFATQIGKSADIRANQGNLITNTFKVLGDSIDRINPLTYLEQFGREIYLDRSLSQRMPEIAEKITYQIRDSITHQVKKQYFDVIEEKIEEFSNEIKKIKKLKTEKEVLLQKEIDLIEQDIIALLRLI